MSDETEHRRDPSWRCTRLDPFTNRDYRDGIGTYRRCPACEVEEARVMERIGQHIRPAPEEPTE